MLNKISYTIAAKRKIGGDDLIKKTFLTCPLCGNEFQHGPHRYEGHRLTLYEGIFCCNYCWEGNWDGWGPDHEEFLIKLLEEKGLPIPERNEEGLLPRN